MLRARFVQWTAGFWGFAAFFPLGFGYAGLALLMLSIACDASSYRSRWVQLRAAPNWWPSCAFVAWVALVLAFGPHYPQTAVNAAHTLRIVLTLALALALSRAELVWALRGFLASGAVGLVLIGMNQIFHLPSITLWSHLVAYLGNKSISDAILFALAIVTCAILFPVLTPSRKVIAAAGVIGAAATLIWILPARTAWLVVFAGALAAGIHQARTQRLKALTTVVVAVTILVVAGFSIPSARDHLKVGVDQAVQAYDGSQSSAQTSWGIRYRLYTGTAEMVRERPLVGWGVGSWNSLWEQRNTGSLARVNMPHNDFLWMGAQAGVPGALLFLLMLAAGIPAAWRHRDYSGRLAFVALISLLLSTALNSALRDAAIGLSLLFVVFLFQRLDAESGATWRLIFSRDVSNGNAERRTS